MAEPSRIKSPEHKHTGLANVCSVSVQQYHKELDSDVSDDADQDLDIVHDE